MTTIRLRSLFSLAGLGLALLLPSAALRAGAVEDATATLRGGVGEVLDIIYRVEDRDTLAASLRPVLEKHFQFATTTRLAVGAGWRQFNAEQRARTTELFTDLVISTYTRRMTGDARPQIDYLAGVELGKGKVELPTAVTYEGKRYSVNYRLSLEPATGAWRIYDVIIEGVSMVANYRGQFGAIYNRGGAAEIIKALENKSIETPVPTS